MDPGTAGILVAEGAALAAVLSAYSLGREPSTAAAPTAAPTPGAASSAAIEEAKGAVRQAEEAVKAAEERAQAAEAAAAAAMAARDQAVADAVAAEQQKASETAAAAPRVYQAAVEEAKGAVRAAEERAQAAEADAAVAVAAKDQAVADAVAAEQQKASEAAAAAVAAAPVNENPTTGYEPPASPLPRISSASSVASSLYSAGLTDAGRGFPLPGVPQRSALSDAVDALRVKVAAIKEKVSAAHANGWKTRRMNEAITEAAAVAAKQTAEEKRQKMIAERAERAAKNSASVRNAAPVETSDQRQAAVPVRAALLDADHTVELAMAARRSSVADPRTVELESQLAALLDFLAQTEAEFAVPGEPVSRAAPRPGWRGGRRTSHRRHKNKKTRKSTFRRNRKH